MRSRKRAASLSYGGRREAEGMFCLLCRKHNAVNTQNKSSKYSHVRAVRYKRTTVEDHGKPKQFEIAVETDLINRVSFIAEEIRKSEDKKEDVYCNSFLATYWLMKEELPNERGVAQQKFTSLSNLHEQFGVEDMKYFRRRSVSSVREMLLLLGIVVKSQHVQDISRASCYGLLADGVCDVANKEQLVTFMKFFHHDTGKTSTALSKRHFGELNHMFTRCHNY